MKDFWKFLLRRSLPTDSLRSLKFAVVGLGDSSYLQFNFVAKRLHKRLIQLGGTPISSAALCDDQHDLGIAAELFPFLDNLWMKLLELKPMPVGEKVLTETTRFTRWNVVKTEQASDVDDLYADFESSPTDGFVEVVENVRTTAEDHFQDVRLLSFCRCNLNWKSGDVAYIRPRNSAESVDRLFEIFNEHNLDIKPNDSVQLQQIDKGELKFHLKFIRFSTLCISDKNLRITSENHTYSATHSDVHPDNV